MANGQSSHSLTADATPFARQSAEGVCRSCPNGLTRRHFGPLRRLAKRREHPFTVNFEYFLSLVSTFVKSVRIAAFGDTAGDLYICIKCAAVLPIDVLWETAIFSSRESANGLPQDQA